MSQVIYNTKYGNGVFGNAYLLALGWVSSSPFSMTSSEEFQHHFNNITRIVCCGCYMKKNIAFTLISFHFLRTSKMFKSGPFWWWWKNTNNWGCNATVQYWQWKTLTNFNLWWDSNTFGVTLSRIWKNRSEIFHGTFCIQWRPRCTLQELGEQENNWFVSKFLLDSKGQIMSDCIYGIIHFPKYHRKIW